MTEQEPGKSATTEGLTLSPSLDLAVEAAQVTRKDLAQTSRSLEDRVADVITQPVRFVYDDCTVWQAADHMVNHAIGRLPVVSRLRPHDLVGIITRSDVLSVYQQRASESELQAPTISIKNRTR